MSEIILALYVLTSSLALILLKWGTRAGLPVNFIDHRIHLKLNTYNVSGILLFGISFLLYMYLISKNDLGYIIPLAAAFVYILIFLGSYFIFHEVFNTTKIIGIVMILGGLIFLNIKK